MRESPSLDIVTNKRYIEVNQDELGNQAKATMPPSYEGVHVYQSLVHLKDQGGLSMGVLGVNWDDALT